MKNVRSRNPYACGFIVWIWLVPSLGPHEIITSYYANRPERCDASVLANSLEPLDPYALDRRIHPPGNVVANAFPGWSENRRRSSFME